VDAETPYEFVKRRRAEGATTDQLKAELLAQGHGGVDVALLLGQRAGGSIEVAPSAELAPAGGTPWELVKKLRAEGFPPDAIARELERAGSAPEDIRALLVDEHLRPTDAAQSGGGLPVQLIFGLLLIVAGALLILGGRISLFAIGLVISGVARAGSAFAADRGTALKDEARRKMATVADDDPRARCAVHQQYASIGNCPRCGSFCCAMCTPARGFATGNVCMRCQAIPEVQAERGRKGSRVAALTLLSPPIMLLVLVALEVFASSAPDLLNALGAVGVGSLPFLLFGAVQWRVRGSWPLFASVVPWLLVEILLTRGNSGFQGSLWLLPLGVMFFGWVNLRQGRTLEEPLVPELSSPAP
jgi:hypothetical protein